MTGWLGLAALCAPLLLSMGCPGFDFRLRTDQTDLFVCVLDPTCTRVLSVAHRGAGLEGPENSIAGLAFAWNLGVDVVALDLRTSADGVLVLMHDATVARTTNGFGPVSSLSLRELRRLVVYSPDPLVPDGSIPTYAEALDYVDGRLLAIVDVRDADPAEVLFETAAAGMLDQVIFRVGSIAEAQAIAALEPDAVLMGVAGSEAETIGFLTLTNVDLVQADRDLVTLEGVEAVHAAGVKVAVNAVGGLDALARALGSRAYDPILDLGVDLVETDYPALLSLHLDEIGAR